jgi:hypothetical protein
MDFHYRLHGLTPVATIMPPLRGCTASANESRKRRFRISCFEFISDFVLRILFADSDIRISCLCPIHLSLYYRVNLVRTFLTKSIQHNE